MNERQSIATTWGSLCGLKAADLTDTQMEKLPFSKLLEFTEDPRVEELLITKLNITTSWEQERITLAQKELAGLEKFKVAYNDWIRNDCPASLKSNYDRGYYYRSNTTIWNLLDDNNRERELERFISNKGSIISSTDLDFEWFLKYNPEQAKQAAATMVANTHSPYDMSRLLGKMPKEIAESILPMLFKKHDKQFHVAALDSPYLSDRHIIRALKTLSKIRYTPEPRAKIKIAHLIKLPPITRLEVLEKLAYKNLRNFTDIKNEEELKELVFSSMTRHYQRVQSLLKIYTRN